MAQHRKEAQGLYLVEQNAKGGKDKWKFEAEIEHDYLLWRCYGDMRI